MTRPTQKLGIAMKTVTKTRATWSAAERRRTAQSTPTGTPTSQEKATAISAIWAVIGAAPQDQVGDRLAAPERACRGRRAGRRPASRGTGRGRAGRGRGWRAPSRAPRRAGAYVPCPSEAIIASGSPGRTRMATKISTVMPMSVGHGRGQAPQDVLAHAGPATLAPRRSPFGAPDAISRLHPGGVGRPHSAGRAGRGPAP